MFWASEGSQATLLIGHDDEAWNVALTLPLTHVDEIVRDAGTFPEIPVTQNLIPPIVFRV